MLLRWKGQIKKKRKLNQTQQYLSDAGSSSSSSSSSSNEERNKFREKSMKKAGADHTRHANGRKVIFRNQAVTAFQDESTLNDHVDEESKYAYDQRKVM